MQVGTPGRWGNLLRWGKKKPTFTCTCNLTTPPSRGALPQDYWMVAKLVNKRNAGMCCSSCNLQYLGILLLPLIMMQGHRQSVFCANLMYCESDPGYVGYPTLKCLHGKIWPQLRGLPGLADRATLPTLNQIKIRKYMDWRVTPPKRVTSPASGPPPQCKQALSAWWYLESFHGLILLFMYMYLCLGCMWGYPYKPQ